MSEPLPPIRADLDFLPSPVEDRPGLLIRDPFHYSDAMLIIPPALIPCLEFFDGTRSALDLREMLVRLTGDLRVGELQEQITGALNEAGFLENDVYRAMRREREAAFAASPLREATHAGSAYPADPQALRTVLDGYLLDGGAPPERESGLAGIAAPHVSPEGGRACYRAAFGALGEEYADRIFVVLGTSHYGEPDRFGLTRKPYATPYGEAVCEVALVERLIAAGGGAVKLEDYCHAVEHSIEFQVLFLQHLFGPRIRVLPILCGSFGRALLKREPPERGDTVRRFLDALRELNESGSGRLLWVLGIDLAHIGRRYGDAFAAQSGDARMEEVARRDAERLERVVAGDREGFWNLVCENRDGLRWCGAAALYTFLYAVPEARGRLREYGQWSIDPQSAVTFAALSFRTAPAGVPSTG